MRVSIVIPVLNEAPNVARAVELAWAAGADEVLVVDGGSSDDTVAVAQRVRCEVQEGPMGRGSQQNLGAQHASGEALLFLHADSWLEEGGVQQVRDALCDTCAAAGAFQHRIDAKGVLYRLIERGNALRVRWRGMAYGDQGIFVRREVLQQVGGFPEIPLMEDVRLMRRLRGKRLVLLAGPLHTSARRWQRHGVLRQTLRNWWLRLAEAVGVAPERLAAHYRVHGTAPQVDLPRHLPAGTADRTQEYITER